MEMQTISNLFSLKLNIHFAEYLLQFWTSFLYWNCFLSEYSIHLLKLTYFKKFWNGKALPGGVFHEKNVHYNVSSHEDKY